MLLHVSNGAYIEGSLMAAKFIVHVEILFGAIDRLDGLTIKDTSQGSPSTCGTDCRSAIPKGIQITLPEDCQLLLLTKQNV